MFCKEEYDVPKNDNLPKDVFSPNLFLIKRTVFASSVVVRSLLLILLACATTLTQNASLSAINALETKRFEELREVCEKNASKTDPPPPPAR